MRIAAIARVDQRLYAVISLENGKKKNDQTYVQTCNQAMCSFFYKKENRIKVPHYGNLMNDVSIENEGTTITMLQHFAYHLLLCQCFDSH